MQLALRLPHALPDAKSAKPFQAPRQMVEQRTVRNRPYALRRPGDTRVVVEQDTGACPAVLWSSP